MEVGASTRPNPKPTNGVVMSQAKSKDSTPAAGDDLAAIEQEFEVVRALAAAVNAGIPEDDPIYAMWEARESAVLGRIEALPATRANATIKAKAIALVYGDDLSAFAFPDHQRCASQRLTLQIFQGLLAENG